jgi:hypothetical protein
VGRFSSAVVRDERRLTLPRKLPPKPDEKPQIERFIEAAKEVGAAETDEGLSDAIRRVATKAISESASASSRRSSPKGRS